ncbi:cell division protein ZapA [Roseococcus sp. SDR]|uniref:cell division protein ZapA n=1 Tax=Roseococcus sp. SDR TaxID=2835532 RepID=UPI001BCC1A3C|nr:cell division protein ZapA [Roseococcus sp. SDR]MBS7791880.1 cell division protein ZapA [Roseococcus sp. SDR]MBV1847194.1 cell division protein ZapA [Roseococcus sp. SDR]
MGQVNIRVNGYSHTIGCKDGEEQHVQDLVGQIEEKVRVIRSMGGQFSESRMLLHVALLFADEANDLRIDLARLRSQGGVATTAAPATDPRLAERLSRIAERIEGIASAIEKP